MINDKQVHGLSKELLSQRKVEIIDIAAVSCNYWSKIIGTAKLDFSMFISQKTQRGPLSKGWQVILRLFDMFNVSSLYLKELKHFICLINCTNFSST